MGPDLGRVKESKNEMRFPSPLKFTRSYLFEKGLKYININIHKYVCVCCYELNHMFLKAFHDFFPSMMEREGYF